MFNSAKIKPIVLAVLIELFLSEVINDSVSQSISQSVGQSVGRSVSQSVSQSVIHPVKIDFIENFKILLPLFEWVKIDLKKFLGSVVPNQH